MGESLSNSSDVSQGKDTHGPTALINSVTKFPMENAGNGMVLDVKFTPSLLEEETGQRAHVWIQRVFLLAEKGDAE